MYEHNNTLLDLAKLVWQLSASKIYEEKMSLTYLHSLTEREPKLMWILGAHKPELLTADAFKSPNSTMFSAPPLQQSETLSIKNNRATDSTTTSATDANQSLTIIDLNVSDPINSSSSLSFGDSSTGRINDQCATVSNSIKEGNDMTIETVDSSVVEVDDIPEEESGAELLPAFRKQYEKAKYDSLKVLYTEALNFPYVEV